MGVLKAKVNSVWVPISQGYSSAQVGYVAHKELVANQAGISAQVDVTGFSVTFTAIPGHVYKTTAVVGVSKQTTASDVYVLLNRGATQLAGAFITMGINENATLVAEKIETGLSGVITQKVMATSATGTMTVAGSATYPSILLVEDITTVQPADGSLVGAWQNITFNNGWANKGGTDQTCQYRKIGDIVYLRGTMTKTGITYGASAFQLPVGYRPSATLRPNPLGLNNAGTQSLFRADILSDGNYNPQAGAADAGWWAIDYQFSVTA